MKILLLVFWIGIATLSFAQSPAQDPPAFSPADEVTRALPRCVRLGGESGVRVGGNPGQWRLGPPSGRQQYPRALRRDREDRSGRNNRALSVLAPATADHE